MIESKDCVQEMDRDLERRVVIYLEGHQRIGFRRLRVKARQGEVTLQGVVGSFYEKQLCMRCCRHVAGVIKVIDQLEVVMPASPALWDD